MCDGVAGALDVIKGILGTGGVADGGVEDWLASSLCSIDAEDESSSCDSILGSGGSAAGNGEREGEGEGEGKLKSGCADRGGDLGIAENGGGPSSVIAESDCSTRGLVGSGKGAGATDEPDNADEADAMRR